MPMPTAAVASSSPIGFSKICGLPISSSSEHTKLHCKPAIASSKSELFGGAVCVNLGARSNGRGRLPASRVVSPKAVSDSSPSLTCLDPDASSVYSLSLSHLCD